MIFLVEWQGLASCRFAIHDNPKKTAVAAHKIKQGNGRCI